MYVHCTMLIFHKIPAVKTCLCTKISYLKSDLLLLIIWIFRVILLPPPPKKKKKNDRKDHLP